LPFITGGGFTPVSCNNKPEICDFGCYSAMRLSKIKARGIALYLEKNSFILVDFFFNQSMQTFDPRHFLVNFDGMTLPSN
jgi:hypothetical protein